MITLRDYQAADVERLRASLRQGKRAPLYVLPTGGGKTVVFCYIGQQATVKGKRVFVLVHREELLLQTSRSLEGLGVDHGLIAPGFTPAPRAPVQVASVQTLVRRLDKITPPDLAIIDEGHHAVAGSWRKILGAWSDAVALGVTATACRLNGAGLGIAAGGVYDDIIIGPSIGDLIADGYLTAPQCFVPPSLLDMEGVRDSGGDFAPGETAKRVDKPTITGDAVKHYSKICPGQPAIAFCASVAHAEHVAAQFRAAGYRAQSIDGTMHDRERRAAIAALGSGRLDVLTSCEIVSEGTDIPVVAAAILLRPTKSLALFLQQVGRALRPVYPAGLPLGTRAERLAAIAASIKPRAFILDHVGNIDRHGLPDEPRDWSLAGETAKRKRSRIAIAGPDIRQCPACFAVHPPARVCPACGHEYEPQLVQPRQVAGELKPITEEQAAAIRQRAALRQGRAKTLEELKEYAQAKGYKPGWAEHVWRAREAKKQKAGGEAAF